MTNPTKDSSPTTSRVQDRTRLSYIENHDLSRILTDADLSNFVELASDLINCSMAYVSLVDDQRTIFVETKNMDATAFNREATPDTSVVRSGSPEVLKDLHEAVPEVENLKPAMEYHWRGWAAVPLTTREQHVIGTVGVASRVPRRFDQVDVHCLHTIAWEITNRIHDSFDGEQSDSDRDVLRTAVQELTLFRNLVDESNDAFMVVCPDSGNYIRVNDEACRQHGYTRDALLDRTVMDLVREISNVSDWQKRVNQIRDEERMVFEVTHERRDGTPFPAEVSLRYDRANDLITMVVRDISERKEKEEELKRINTFLSSIVSNLPGIVYVKNADDLSFELCNSGMAELVDQPRNEIIGQTDYDLFSDEEAEFYRMQDRKVLDSGEDKVVNEPLTMNGEQRLFRSHKVPITDNSGEPLYLLGFTEDITEEKRIREKLEKEKLFLQQVLESSPDAILVVDEHSRLTRVNEKAESMFGYDRTELVGMNIKALMPDRFRDRHEEHFRRYFSEPEIQELGRQIDLHGLGSDGEEFPVEIRLSPLDAKEIQRVIATVRERG